MAFWLFTIAGMIFFAVVLGGLTRLTHSGLSMVEWKPLTGWIPPITEADWQDAFGRYRQFPEYRKLNQGMTLAEFKAIFWLEYLHRLWGRLLALAFLVPFGVFLFKGWVGRRLGLKLGLLFVLGALQGALGWYMVASGLVDHPDVSQYRLAAHLALALVIYGFALWLALDLWSAGRESGESGAGLRAMAVAALGLVLATAIAGAFVAGLDAGLIYNTFPLMDGALVPDGLYGMEPPILSAFEDVKTVQFNHRVLALLALLLSLALGVKAARTAGLKRRQWYAVLAVPALATGQAGLGVATLLATAPLPLAAAHQAGSVVLLTGVVWCLHELRRRPQ